VIVRTAGGTRLWHQLTTVLEQVVTHSELAPRLKALYDNFVTDFETKINQLKLVQFAIVVAAQLSGKYSGRVAGLARPGISDLRCRAHGRVNSVGHDGARIPLSRLCSAKAYILLRMEWNCTGEAVVFGELTKVRAKRRC
jgi:hypothetical protein